MQLLPDTARGIAVRTGGDGFVVNDLYVPEMNVRYGAWYLRNLLDRYERRAHGARRLPRRARATSTAGGEQGVGIQFPETRDYVDNVEKREARSTPTGMRRSSGCG